MTKDSSALKPGSNDFYRSDTGANTKYPAGDMPDYTELSGKSGVEAVLKTSNISKSSEISTRAILDVKSTKIGLNASSVGSAGASLAAVNPFPKTAIRNYYGADYGSDAGYGSIPISYPNSGLKQPAFLEQPQIGSTKLPSLFSTQSMDMGVRVSDVPVSYPVTRTPIVDVTVINPIEITPISPIDSIISGQEPKDYPIFAPIERSTTQSKSGYTTDLMPSSRTSSYPRVPSLTESPRFPNLDFGSKSEGMGPFTFNTKRGRGKRKVIRYYPVANPLEIL